MEGQISMLEFNFVSHWKALSSPCPGTGKILVCVSHGWLFGVYTTLARLFTKANSHFFLQISLATLLNVAPHIIIAFQPYWNLCGYFLRSVSPVLLRLIQAHYRISLFYSSQNTSSLGTGNPIDRSCWSGEGNLFLILFGILIRAINPNSKFSCEILPSG